MGLLINVVGNLGVGKTTLAAQLAQRLSAATDWESPTARPFQQLFSEDRQRWALANQLDFFRFRATQELTARNRPVPTLHDGGLDQDFWVFCHLMRAADYLSAAEFQLCRESYELYRSLLPRPELTIYMAAPVPLIQARRQLRGRPNDDNIIPLELLNNFQAHLDNWLTDSWPGPILIFDASKPDFWPESALDELASQVRQQPFWPPA